MAWRNYSTVAQPDTFTVKSSPRVSGMTPSFFLRLGPVRGSSEARTRMMGRSGTAGKGGRGAATNEFKRTQRHHSARAAFDRQEHRSSQRNGLLTPISRAPEP